MERSMEHPFEQHGSHSSISEREIEEAIEECVSSIVIPDVHAASAGEINQSFKVNFSDLLHNAFDDALKGHSFTAEDKLTLPGKVTQKLLDLYDHSIPGFAEKHQEIESLYNPRLKEMKGKVSMEEWMEAKREKDEAFENAIAELISERDARQMSAA